MSRKDPITNFDVRTAPGPLKRVVDILHALFGKVTSLTILTLLADENGFTVTGAATDPGTELTTSRTTIDFEDAGVDSIRFVVRGEGLAGGDVEARLYNVTTASVMATATLSGTSEQTAQSAWVVYAPNGGDEEVEIRVVGDGAGNPVIYVAHVHMRTVQARA